MLEFKKIKISDIETIKKYTNTLGIFSCETSFVNLFVWQNVYKNMYAEKDGMLFIKSGADGNENFRLPFGKDLKKGIELLREYIGEDPVLWMQQGERFSEIEPYISENYELSEKRNAFDYIYLQQDLANLSGKKYHSKRNHISSFSKQHDWQYKEITNGNINDVLKCAEEWYKANAERYDKYMQCEHAGIEDILENMDILNVKGGAIYVDGKVVAFTLGSPINDLVFDVHIEKALPEYATAYTVINNEFAKTLGDYKYINREDDMGLEGLRKAKLSYKPEILLKKYLCVPKKTVCKNLYHNIFGDDTAFEDELFDTCFKYCKCIKKDGKIVSFCFALPCEIQGKQAVYIYALATDENYRGQGYAKQLIEKIKAESDATLILRPTDESLFEFYEKLGFQKFTATNNQNAFKLTPVGEFAEISEKYKEKSGNFTAMYLSDKPQDFENLYFPYSMP